MDEFQRNINIQLLKDKSSSMDQEEIKHLLFPLFHTEQLKFSERLTINHTVKEFVLPYVEGRFEELLLTQLKTFFPFYRYGDK